MKPRIGPAYLTLAVLFTLVGTGACSSKSSGACGTSLVSLDSIPTATATELNGWKVADRIIGVSADRTTVVTQARTRSGTVTVARQATDGTARWATTGSGQGMDLGAASVATERSIAVLDDQDAHVVHCFRLPDDTNSTFSLLGGNEVVAFTGPNIAVYDLATGKERWGTVDAQRGNWQLSESLLLGFSDEGITAFDLATGGQAWAWSLPADATRPFPSEVAIGDARIVIAQPGLITALDLSSGAVLWTSDAGGEIAASDGTSLLVQLDSGKDFVALDNATGEISSPNISGRSAGLRPREPIALSADGQILAADGSTPGRIEGKLDGLTFEYATKSGVVLSSTDGDTEWRPIVDV